MAKKNIYLCATYYARPRNPSQTFKSGYMKDENNIAWDEQVIVTVGLKNKEANMAKVVLNITEQKVVKNSFNNGRDFMELFQYFYNSSPKELSHALQQVGITFGRVEEPTNEPVQDSAQIHVQAETEEGTRSEPTTSTDTVVPSESNKRRKRKGRSDADAVPAATGPDIATEAQT